MREGLGEGAAHVGTGRPTPARPLSCSDLLNCPFIRAPLLPPAAAALPHPQLLPPFPGTSLSPQLPCLLPLSTVKAVLKALGPLGCSGPCLLLLAKDAREPPWKTLLVVPDRIPRRGEKDLYREGIRLPPQAKAELGWASLSGRVVLMKNYLTQKKLTPAS